MRDVFLIARLVFQRGFGSFFYAYVAMRYLPASCFVRDLYLLGFVDFLFGMAIFTLRISALHQPESDKELFSVSVLLAALVFAVSCIFYFNPVNAIIIAASAFIFPFSLILLVAEERKDVKALAGIESATGLIGSVLSAAIIFCVDFFWKNSELLSPLIRPLVIQFLLFFVLFCRNSTFVFPAVSLPSARELFSRFGGLDYLALYAAFRIKALSLLAGAASLIGGGDLSKAVIVLYDPIAGIMGYVLRFRYASMAFDGKKYAASVSSFFYMLLLVCVSFIVLGFFLKSTDYNGLLFAFALLFFSLFSAGITTQVVRASFLDRVFLLIGLALGCISFYLGLGLAVGLAGAVLWYLFVFKKICR